MKKIFYLIIPLLMLTSCGKEEDTKDDNQLEDDLQYSLKITNPIDTYTVALGSKVALTIEPDEQMNIYSHEVRFYIDGQELNLTPVDEYEMALFYNNYAYQWEVTGLTTGNHTLKAEIVEDDYVVARDEISINITNPQWEAVDISGIVGSDQYVITDISLLDDHTGWISGYVPGGMDFLLKTTDKGATWQLVNSSIMIEKIDFFDQNTGVAIEYYADKVYKTFDGGASFTLVTDPATNASLFYHALDVAFSQTSGEFQVTSPLDYSDDPEYVFRINMNDNSILQSTQIVDDAQNWGAFYIRFDEANALIYNMVHYNNDTQYIQLSNDNGQSWLPVDIPPPANWYGGTNNYSVEGGDISGNNIWLTGGDTTDYLSAFSAVSNDGGNTWQINPVEDKLSFNTGSLLDVAITGNNSAYAVCYAGPRQPEMYYSDDNGTHWYPVYEVSPGMEDHHVGKIEFNTGFGIAGGESTLYRYTGN